MTIIQINNAIQINQARLDRLYARQRELGVYDYEKFSERLIFIINRHFNCNIEIMKRDAELVKGRQFYYAIMRSQTPFSLKRISLCHQDHATVLNALKKFDDFIRIDKKYKKDYEKIISKINFVN
jgi:chromosomal replication initiation ATPase DnaA